MSTRLRAISPAVLLVLTTILAGCATAAAAPSGDAAVRLNQVVRDRLERSDTTLAVTRFFGQPAKRYAYTARGGEVVTIFHRAPAQLDVTVERPSGRPCTRQSPQGSPSFWCANDQPLRAGDVVAITVRGEPGIAYELVVSDRDERHSPFRN